MVYLGESVNLTDFGVIIYLLINNDIYLWRALMLMAFSLPKNVLSMRKFLRPNKQERP